MNSSNSKNPTLGFYFALVSTVCVFVWVFWTVYYLLILGNYSLLAWVLNPLLLPTFFGTICLLASLLLHGIYKRNIVASIFGTILIPLEYLYTIGALTSWSFVSEDIINISNIIVICIVFVVGGIFIRDLILNLRLAKEKKKAVVDTPQQSNQL